MSSKAGANRCPANPPLRDCSDRLSCHFGDCSSWPELLAVFGDGDRSVSIGGIRFLFYDLTRIDQSFLVGSSSAGVGVLFAGR